MRASRRTPQEPLGPRSPVTVDDFDFDFTANPNVTPEVINLPDRGLRHREKSPADRDRHRSRRSGHESPLHHHCEPGQRTVPRPPTIASSPGCSTATARSTCSVSTSWTMPSGIFHRPRGTQRGRGRLQRPFSEWRQTFSDQRLCSAIVDRLTFSVNRDRCRLTFLRCECSTSRSNACCAVMP